MEILKPNFTTVENGDTFIFDYVIRPTVDFDGITTWDQFYRRSAWKGRSDGKLPTGWTRIPLDRGRQGVFYPIPPFLRDSDRCVTRNHVTWTIHTPPRVTDLDGRNQWTVMMAPKPFMSLKVNDRRDLSLIHI